MSAEPAESKSETTRRTFLAGTGFVFLGLLDFLDGVIGEELEDAIIAVDEVDERADYDSDQYDLFIATDDGGVYLPDETDGGWKLIKETGHNPVLGSAIVEDLKTKKIGVSAAVGADQTVPTDEENSMAISKTSEPYFDDFGELDSENNKVVLEHGTHHEIVAHADLGTAAAAGQVWLRVFVNGTQRARDHTDVKNGEDAVLEASIYLKLSEGDEVEAKIEHDTGSDETFPKDENFLSVVRQ